ncbi:MAG: tetratricopeptide repeat protein [Sandaracinaceae bacterium]
MKHLRIALTLLLLAGCGAEATTPSPAPAPEPATAEPTEPASDEPPAAPNAAPSSPEPATVRRLLNEGREALHGGDADTANTRFTALLELAPAAPRFWCEAGFVSLRAGDRTTAAQRLDTGLGMYGAPPDIDEALREALAMCLYNRGRVYEEEHESEMAIRMYEQSLTLRDHPSVVAHRDAMVQEHRTTPVDPSYVQGIQRSEDHVFMTTDLARLTQALPAAMQTHDGLPVRVESRAQIDIEGRRAEVFEIDGAEEPYSSLSLAVALPVRGGYRLQMTELTWFDADGDESSAAVSNVSAAIEHGLLRVEAELRSESYVQDLFDRPGGGTCYLEGYARPHVERFTLLCTLDGTGQCGRIRRSAAHEGSDSEFDVSCEDEDGHAVDDAPAPPPMRASALPAYALGLAVGADGRITLSPESGTPPSYLDSWFEAPWTLRRWITEAPEAGVDWAQVQFDEPEHPDCDTEDCAPEE